MLNKIEKRDGRKVKFSPMKIHVAALSAITSVESTRSHLDCEIIAHDIEKSVREKLKAKYENSDNCPNVEEIQDLVQQELFNAGLVTEAKHFIEYREQRTAEREKKSELIKTYSKMLNSKATDMNLMRENANIDGNSVMGTMLRIGSEANKSYVDKYILKPEWSYAHSNGDIHIHDKDFYELTFNCFQIPLKKLFKNGFSTGHGFLRPPKSIRTASELAAIAIQSEQNDQFGGTSISCFEDDLAPYVAVSFSKYVRELLRDVLRCETSFDEISKVLDDLYTKYNTVLSEEVLHILGNYLLDNYPLKPADVDYIVKRAVKKTDDETYQGMEAFIHNMNSLHSRCLPENERVVTLNIKKTKDLDKMSDVEKQAFKDLIEQLYESRTVEEIAAELSTSLKTMKNIFKKLNINTRSRQETTKTYPFYACAKNIKNSKGENDLANQIKEKFNIIIIRNVKNLMKEMPFHEIDIYLPEINLGIEYNEIYWHDKNQYFNELMQNIFECKERMKDYYSVKNGFDLIQIFEDDYLQNKDDVLSFVFAEIEKRLENE